MKTGLEARRQLGMRTLAQTIPRCPPTLIGINLAPGKGGKRFVETLRDFFEIKKV